jgi:hypothetical protein
MIAAPDTANQEEARKPWPFAEEMAGRQRAIVRGAEPWNDPVEERRANRRRDMEMLRLASMEAAFHITEFIAGRLPNWKKPALEGLDNPVAALANLNRSIIQITLAEERFDETREERALRIKAEAEAQARAEREAEAGRLQAEATLRRAENKREVQGAVRAVTLSNLNLTFSDREKRLGELFRELEVDAGSAPGASIYDGDPVEAAVGLCLRLGIAPREPADPKSLLERRAALTELARAHIEALRGGHAPAGDVKPAANDAAAPAAQAQGPPGQ